MITGELINRSFKVCLMICLLCFLTWQLSNAQNTVDGKISRLYFERVADRLYETREIPHNLELAIQNYKKALKIIAHQSVINWKNYSKLAIEQDSENSNAHLWYSLNAGSQALERGVMNTLYMRDALKKALETAIKFEPDNVNAILGLAVWYFYVPTLFGGDHTKTFALIDQALKIDPNYTTIYYRKAEMLVAEKRYSEAVDVLQRLLQIKNPTLPGDGREDKSRARELLKTIEGEG